MKLLELEIHNIRGIRELLLKPAGNNMVIWGPNGSGKSSVVDAVDFLLTGDISRLKGRGTGGIKLGEHGRHIDSEPEEAWVRGVLQLPKMKKPVEIKRCVAEPKDFMCNPDSARPKLQPVLALAKRGQHVLTRREILKYITAERKTRAQEIQTLLDIDEVENIRAALVKVRNRLQKDAKATQRAVKGAEGAVNATLQFQTFDEKAALQEVNRIRAVLEGAPIETLTPETLKDSLRQPVSSRSGEKVNRGLFEKHLNNLQAILSPKRQQQITQKDQQLREHLAEIRRDHKLLEALQKHQLLELGLDLLDESGRCPLCETPWEVGALKAYLEKRLADAQTAASLQKQISDLSSGIAEAVNTLLASVQYVGGTAHQAGCLDEDVAALQIWANKLKNLARALNVPLEAYPPNDTSTEQVQRMLAPGDINKILERINEEVVAAYPKKSPELTAWDTLTALAENLKHLEQAQTQANAAQLALRRAQQLHDAFITARDTVLQQLYDAIRTHFESLYRQLHGADESEFKAVFAPTDAGLELWVDFHGRGEHPPQALHSEGHQDSMGICLYLALAEQLTEGKLDLIILDDVMMSIDAEHRRGLCALLAQAFPNKQFLITTHDKTWASQLKYEGVVSSKGMVELFNWDITTGPLVNSDVDLWNRIQRDLNNSDVPAAAARLRRNSEMFFGMVCDALGAPVPYKMYGRWELGDLLPAAMGQYRRLLKKAKKSAQSWGDQERLDELNELNSQASQIFKRSNAEQWAVNASVHYNSWANLSPKDFEPVAETFQDLYGLFTCSKCGGLLRVARASGQTVAVRCNCGTINWNLAEKQKS